MDSCDSSQTSSSDEEDTKLKPLQPLDSNKGLCKVIDILPGNWKCSMYEFRLNWNYLNWTFIVKRLLNNHGCVIVSSEISKSDYFHI